MTVKQKALVCHTIDNEGFDYGLRSYSSFPEVKDKEFHRLRQEYIDAAKAIEKYVGWDEWEDGEFEVFE
jgi:hypothetical protein